MSSAFDEPSDRLPANDRASTPLRWLVAPLLFACFFLATQDLRNPLLWRDEGAVDISAWVGNVADGQAKRQVGFLALAAVGLLGLVLPSRRGPAPGTPHWIVLYPLVAIVGWAYASLVWSAEPSLTLKRLVVFTAMWSSIAAVVRHFSMRDLVFMVGFYGIASLLVGVYAELRVQDLTGGLLPWRFAGSMSPNHSGLTATLLAMAMAHGLSSPDLSSRGRSIRIVVLFAALLILWMTRSRTSLAIAVLALGIQTAMTMRPSRTAALAGIGGLVLAGGTFLYHSGLLGPVWEAALMGREESDVRTLTGRTDIWIRTIELTTADPARALVGFGYDTFWNAAHADDVSRRVGFTISEGHNAWIEAWVNLGIVGAVAWTLAIVAGGATWLSRGRREGMRWSPDAAFAVALCAAALVQGIAEAAFTHAQFCTFVLFAVCTHAAVRLPRKEELR